MFYRFIPRQDAKGQFYLSFGPAVLQIDRWGSAAYPRINDPAARDAAEVATVIGAVALALPALVAEYKARTGLRQFGKYKSGRYGEMLAFMAERLNATLDAPAAPPADDGGVFG